MLQRESVIALDQKWCKTITDGNLQIWNHFTWTVSSQNISSIAVGFGAQGRV